MEQDSELGAVFWLRFLLSLLIIGPLPRKYFVMRPTRFLTLERFRESVAVVPLLLNFSIRLGEGAVGLVAAREGDLGSVTVYGER